jgi:hypothetical protein
MLSAVRCVFRDLRGGSGNPLPVRAEPLQFGLQLGDACLISGLGGLGLGQQGPCSVSGGSFLPSDGLGQQPGRLGWQSWAPT